MDVTLIFGSNMGDRKAVIQEAMKQLEEIGKIQKISSLYETAPWGFESPDTFYNQVALYSTCLSAENVLKKCMETERALGRKRSSSQYCSRIIDIDILFYDSCIINTPDLVIPHPRIAERNFVLTPLNEIIPDFIHPLTGKKISEHFTECPDSLLVIKRED